MSNEKGDALDISVGLQGFTQGIQVRNTESKQNFCF